MADEFAYAVFPYLKTSRSFRIRGFEFRSTADLADAPPEFKADLSVISQLFFLEDDKRIKQVTYSIVQHPKSDRDLEKLMNDLNQARNVVSYLYSSTHEISGDTFMRDENCALLLLIPEDLLGWPYNSDNPDIDFAEDIGERASLVMKTPGYRVRVIGGREVRDVSHGSRIYPSSWGVFLNTSQDLASDVADASGSIRQRVTSHLSSKGKVAAALEDRIFTAIEWYNKSNSAASTASSELVNLAIAFESLLDLPRERKKESFKSAVSLLLGPIAKLETWLNQFYEARSAIVHQGQTETLFFIARPWKSDVDSGSKPFYRSLVSYGRQIFGACLTAILEGSASAKSFELASQLTTNSERFESIMKTLSQTDLNPRERIFACRYSIHEIDKYRFAPDYSLSKECILKGVKVLARTSVEADLDLPRERLQALNALANCDIQCEYEFLEILSALGNISSRTFDPEVLRVPEPIVLSLFDTAWNYLFRHYYYLKDQREK